MPLAIVALCGFVLGGALRDRSTCARATARWDLRSYVAIHMALIFGVGALITGSIWAKALVGPLVGVGRADARLVPDRLPAVRDLPAAALLDRGPRAPGALRVGVRDHRGRVRAAELHRRARWRTAYVHPRVLGEHRRQPAGRRWRSTFLVSLVAMALLFVTLWKYELTAKHTRAQLRALRRRLLGATRSRRSAAAPRSAGAGAAPAPARARPAAEAAS